MVNSNLLKTVSFTNLNRWSVSSTLAHKMKSKYPLVSLSQVMKRIKDPILVENDKLYKRITVRLYGLGVLQRDELYGRDIGTKKQFIARKGQLIISRIDARNGAFGLVPDELDGAIVTNDFWLFDVQNALPQYLILVLSSVRFQQYWKTQSSGTTNRQRVDQEDFLMSKIVLPPIEIQKELLDKYNGLIYQADFLKHSADSSESNLEKKIFDSLGIKAKESHVTKSILNTVKFQNIQQWGYDKIAISFPYSFETYKAHSFTSNPFLLKEIYRGRSPQYSQQSKSFVLNQKCNRKNEIDLTHAKGVNHEWLSDIPEYLLTQKNDIIINSTGEGTLGRASVIVSDEHVGLAYDSHMLLLRVNLAEIDPLLWVYLFNSSLGQKQVDLYKSAQATKQTELGIENTKKIKFPLPSLTVQKSLSELIEKETLSIKEQRRKANELYQQAKSNFEEVIFGE